MVTVDKPISQTFIERMSKGVPVLDTTTKPCKVQKLSRNSFKIILTQGLNRQIRRMCEYLGYEVESLQRVRIMNIHLKSAVGRYRNLTTEELNTLNEALKFSKKHGKTKRNITFFIWRFPFGILMSAGIFIKTFLVAKKAEAVHIGPILIYLDTNSFCITNQKPRTK